MDIKLLLSRLEQRKGLQKKLKLEHVRTLESIDAQIRDLHEKRARMVIRNKEATDAVQREIVELAREIKRVHAAMVAPSQPDEPAAAAVGSASPVDLRAPVAGKTAPRVGQDSSELPSQPPAAGLAPASADPGAAILELLRGRAEVSESLLREKLRARRINVSELSKRLDKMVAEGLIRRRANNYSLGKKR